MKRTIQEMAQSSLASNAKHIAMLLDCLVEEANQSERKRLADSIQFWLESSDFWRSQIIQ